MYQNIIVITNQFVSYTNDNVKKVMNNLECYFRRNIINKSDAVPLSEHKDSKLNFDNKNAQSC